MEFDHFEIENKRLLNWFGKKMSPAQITEMFERLKAIPRKAYAAIVEELIDNSKSFPTINDIKNVYRYKWADKYPEEGKPKFKQNETEEEYYERITVKHLLQAYTILEHQGHDSFMAYCRTHRINDEDIERVESKFNFVKPGKMAAVIQKIEQRKPLKENDIPF